MTRQLATPLGTMVAVAADAGLGLLEFADGPRLEEQRRRVSAHLGMRIVRGTHAHLDAVEEELHAYFAGEGRAFRVPLLLAGTPFQLAVWRRLVMIPFGRTITYDRLARTLGRAGAQRAVGRANGDNPLAIVVPCHRVIGSDGTLTGYGGGLWRKRRLLELEGCLD